MRLLLFLALLLAAAPAGAQPPAADRAPRLTGGDVTVPDFRFRAGETLPELRLHYATLGTPRRDAAGNIVNAVMVLHGTGGSGRQFLAPQFANELYGRRGRRGTGRQQQGEGGDPHQAAQSFDSFSPFSALSRSSFETSKPCFSSPATIFASPSVSAQNIGPPR